MHRSEHRASHVAEVWHLRLYVAGQSPKSLRAFANLKTLCEEHLPGRYEIEVIDLVEQPSLARSDDILAIPTLVRRLPGRCARSSATSPTPNASSSASGSSRVLAMTAPTTPDVGDLTLFVSGARTLSARAIADARRTV